MPASLQVVACVASFDTRRSIHAPTFLRAVELAEEMVVGPRCRLVLYDDAAEAETALRAAADIVRSKPDCVVGHFASAAAEATAPIYKREGLPLLLPAATMSGLTRHANVFRVCDSDEDYVRWLVGAVRERGLRPEAVESDGSLHGNSVVQTFRRLAGDMRFEGDAATLYSGSYAYSVAYACAFAGRHLVLTDDADTPQLADDLRKGGCDLSATQVHVAALRPRARGPLAQRVAAAYRDRYGAAPGTYFWEMIAAIEIASSTEFPGAGPFETVLGTLNFGSDRESRPRNFELCSV